MEEFIELFLEGIVVESRQQVRGLIEDSKINLTCLLRHTNLKDVEFDIIIMDSLLVNFSYLKKIKKEMIEILVINANIRGLIECHKTGFTKKHSTIYEQFYMRSFNKEVIDVVFPDWKKIRVCDILEETGVDCINFESDYDLKFIL